MRPASWPRTVAIATVSTAVALPGVLVPATSAAASPAPAAAVAPAVLPAPTAVALPALRSAAARKKKPRIPTLVVKSERTRWLLRPARFGSGKRAVIASRPCLRLKYRTNRITICLTSRYTASVTHSRSSTSYSVPAKLYKYRSSQRLALSTADLMLRAGSPKVSETCRSSRCPTAGRPAKARGKVTIQPRRLRNCRATAPWRVRSFPARDRLVALTFDDGPGWYTEAVLAVLKREGVPATFFMVGGRARKSPDLVRKVFRRGHVVGNHSNTHADLSRLAGWQVEQELSTTNDAIRAATGFRPCLFRAPYGAEGGAVLPTARTQGMVTVNWNVDPADWSRPGAAAIEARVLGATRPGSIVLLHDGGVNRSQTVAALPKIIRKLRDRGYRFQTLVDALQLPARYR